MLDKHDYNKQEHSVADRMNENPLVGGMEFIAANTPNVARRQPVSGALPGKRGDVDDGVLLWDLKSQSRGAKQATVKLDELDKIRREAQQQGREAGLLLIHIPAANRYLVVADLRDVELLCCVTKDE